MVPHPGIQVLPVQAAAAARAPLVMLEARMA